METATNINFCNSIQYEPGGIVSKIIMKNTAGNVTLFAFDKNQQLSEHTAPYDALVQVIEGKAEVFINKLPFLLQSGESIIMPAGIPHALNAAESFKMILTMLKASS